MIPQCLKGVGVLVVDDDPHVREMVKETVTSAGAVVVTSEDTIGALRTIIHERPDLIICDLNLPGAGGVAIIDGACAADPNYAHRCILMSGDELPREVKSHMDQLGVATLEKPFRIMALLETLSGLLVRTSL